MPLRPAGGIYSRCRLSLFAAGGNGDLTFAHSSGARRSLGLPGQSKEGQEVNEGKSQTIVVRVENHSEDHMVINLE